jgi:hypothetical protein
VGMSMWSWSCRLKYPPCHNPYCKPGRHSFSNGLQAVSSNLEWHCSVARASVLFTNGATCSDEAGVLQQKLV